MKHHAGSKPLRVLYIDIEGGWGGSSRSLFYLVTALDRTKIVPVVWHRRKGPLSDRLDALAVEHRHEPRILSIIPWHSKNWKIWLANVPRLPGLWRLARDIRECNPDVVHLNYEGLVPLLFFARLRGLRAKVVLHLRTQAPANKIYRVYAKLINRYADYLIFITENERNRAVDAGVDVARTAHAVLYNPVSTELFCMPRRGKLEPPLRVAYLATISVAKGASRLLELARLIRDRGLPVHIDAFGRSQRQRRLLVFRGGSLEGMREKVEREGLSGYLTLHDHTTEPERVLSEADLLLRPSILNDPWGRDVLEAMAVGTPVIGIGTYDRFIRSGETGLLMLEWSAEQCAEFLAELCRRPTVLSDMSRHARALARDLCDSSRYARAVEDIYERLVCDAIERIKVLP